MTLRLFIALLLLPLAARAVELHLQFGALERILADQLFTEEGRRYVHGNQKDINNAKGRENQFAELDKITTLQGQKHNLDAGKLQACVKAQDDKPVRASQSEGDKVGVSATPALFVNGQKIDGAVPIEDLRAALDSALRDAGVAIPEHK